MTSAYAGAPKWRARLAAALGIRQGGLKDQYNRGAALMVCWWRSRRAALTAPNGLARELRSSTPLGGISRQHPWVEDGRLHRQPAHLPDRSDHPAAAAAEDHGPQALRQLP